MPLSLGSQTHSIPLSLFRDNRNRVAAALRATNQIKDAASTYIILKGGTEAEFEFYDTDTTQTTFRQASTNWKSHRFSRMTNNDCSL